MTRLPGSRSSSPARSEEAAPDDVRPSASRGGRPSLAQAAELRERILDVATHLFLSLGYGATSIEAVAKRAGISKRTFYHRFDDKPALFAAVVHRIIHRLRPARDAPVIEGANLPEILQRLAGLILHAALSPQALALHRLIVAESARFPQLAAAVHQDGATDEAIRLIAAVLEREAQSRHVEFANATFAAEQFLYMVMTLPQRRAMGLGVPMTASELEAWGRQVVRFFLNGCGLPASPAA